MAERKVRILIVEPNAPLRNGLSLLIQGQPDLDLVDVTGSCSEAVELFVEHRPDVTKMDLDLPDSAGITTIRRILKRNPSTCVLGLSTYEQDAVYERALQARARSCITKDRLDQDLVSLIRDCAGPPD